MKDQISIQRVALLHPKIRTEVANRIDKIELGFTKNMRVRVVQGLRTFAEQNELFAQGRTKPGPIVTWAKGGQSYHNYGLAIDFALLYDKDNNGTFETISWNMGTDFDHDHIADWMEVVSSFKEKGFEWGGDWLPKEKKDYPHLQKLFGHTWHDLLKLHDFKKVDSHGYVII